MEFINKTNKISFPELWVTKLDARYTKNVSKYDNKMWNKYTLQMGTNMVTT